jgi:hypothetical protein
MSPIGTRPAAGAAALLGALALAGPANASGPAPSQAVRNTGVQHTAVQHTAVRTEAQAAALAHVVVPAATGGGDSAKPRHVKIAARRLPDGAAHALRATAAVGPYRASFTVGGHTSTVQMNIYTGSDGHDYAWGEGWLYGSGEALYLDISRDGGSSWTPFVDYRVPSGVYSSTPSHYDGPGYWIRVCGANPNYGSPYNNPQWGWNIACTVWH